MLFSNFNILCHFLLPSVVFNEKSIVVQIGFFPDKIEYFNSGQFQDFLCTYFCSILMRMRLNTDMFKFILFGFHKTSGIYRLFSFPIEEVWGHYFFKKLFVLHYFFPPSRTSRTQMLDFCVFFFFHLIVL